MELVLREGLLTDAADELADRFYVPKLAHHLLSDLEIILYSSHLRGHPPLHHLLLLLLPLRTDRVRLKVQIAD